MTRWLATLVLGTSLLAGPAGAQVFKPKSGSSGTTSKSSGTTSKSSGKTASSSAKRSSTSTKKTTARRAKKRKSSAASKGRPSDLTPDEAPKVDPDYVKIIDDDE